MLSPCSTPVCSLYAKRAGASCVGASGRERRQHLRSLRCVPHGSDQVRNYGDLFMTRWTGKDRVEFLERILVSDVHSLQPTQGRLTLICQEDGGIIDVTVITNAGDYQ